MPISELDFRRHSEFQEPPRSFLGSLNKGILFTLPALLLSGVVVAANAPAICKNFNQAVVYHPITEVPDQNGNVSTNWCPTSQPSISKCEGANWQVNFCIPQQSKAYYLKIEFAEASMRHYAAHDPAIAAPLLLPNPLFLPENEMVLPLTGGIETSPRPMPNPLTNDIPLSDDPLSAPAFKN